MFGLGFGPTLVLILGTLGVGFSIIALFAFVAPANTCCRACKAGVRWRGWAESARCECGAALDRPGAVRAKRRIGIKTLATGLFILLLAIAVTIEDARLRATQLKWEDLIPESMVLSRYQQGDKSAVQSVERRLRAGVLGSAGACAYVEAGLQKDPGGVNFARTNRDEMGFLLRAVQHNDTVMRRLARLFSVPSVQASAADHRITLVVPRSECEVTVRLDQVRLDGRSVEFEAIGHSLGGHWCFGNSIFVVNELAPSTQRVEVDLTLILDDRPSFMALGFDELCRQASPDAWGLDLVTKQMTCTWEAPKAVP